MIGTFVIPPEALADDAPEEEERRGKKRRDRERARELGSEELDRFAERLGRGRDARRLKEFLDRLEQ